MALREECVDAVDCIASSPGRVRLPRETFRRRLAVWGMVAIAASVAVRFKPLVNADCSHFILALSCAFCSCAALGGGLYYFIVFVVSRRVRDLLESVALVTIGSGAALQIVLDSAASRTAPDDRLLTTALLCGAAAFCGAAYSRTEWRPVSRAGSWLQIALSSALVCAFPLAASPYAFESMLVHEPGSAYGAAGLMCPIAAGFLILALVGYCGQHRRTGCRRCAVDCYFLMPLILAAIARTFSSSRADWWSEYAQILFIGAWVVFMAAVSVEQAMSGKESSERLSRLEALHEVSWSLVGAGTGGELLQRLTEAVRDRFEAEIGMVHIATNSRDVMEVAAVSGPEDAVARLGALHYLTGPDFRPGFHTGHTARAFKTATVQTAVDVEVDVELVPWRILAQGTGCAVSVPMVGKGEVFGVLSLYFSECAQMTQQNVLLMEAITAAASPAIEAARASVTGDNPEADITLDIAA